LLPFDLAQALDEVVEFEPRNWIEDAPAECATIVDNFKRLTAELSVRLAALPMAAESSILELQQYSPVLPAGSLHTDYIADLCRNVHRHSSVAAELMKSDRGPKSNTLQMRAVLSLKSEFERAGGIAGHSAKDQIGYIGNATSPFGLFVHCFFAGIDPEDAQRRGLNDAIAFACWPGRRPASIKRAEAAARRRKAQIFELMEKAGVTNFSPDD